MKKYVFIIVTLFLTSCSLVVSDSTKPISVICTIGSRAVAASDSELVDDQDFIEETLSIESLELFVTAEDMDEVFVTSNSGTISVDVPIGSSRHFYIYVRLFDGSEYTGETTADITDSTDSIGITIYNSSTFIDSLIFFNENNGSIWSSDVFATIDGNTITAEIPYSESLFLFPSIETAGVSITYNDGERSIDVLTEHCELDFSSPVELVVTAENGDYRVYTVIVVFAGSGGFSLDGVLDGEYSQGSIYSKEIEISENSAVFTFGDVVTFFTESEEGVSWYLNEEVMTNTSSSLTVEASDFTVGSHILTAVYTINDTLYVGTLSVTVEDIEYFPVAGVVTIDDSNNDILISFTEASDSKTPSANLKYKVVVNYEKFDDAYKADKITNTDSGTLPFVQADWITWDTISSIDLTLSIGASLDLGTTVYITVLVEDGDGNITMYPVTSYIYTNGLNLA